MTAKGREVRNMWGRVRSWRSVSREEWRRDLVEVMFSITALWGGV